MSKSSAGAKTTKFCLLSFRNKKLNSTDGVCSILEALSGYGYYFDKVSFVDFSNSEEIVRSLKDAAAKYENVFIYCPKEMESLLKDFIAKSYSAEFDGLGILTADNANVFILYCDASNRLHFEDIKKILDKKYGVKYARAYFKTVGAPHSAINEAIKRAKRVCSDIEFNVTEKYGDCSIELVYTSNTPKMVIDEITREVTLVLNRYIYSYENDSLAQRLYQLLKLRRLKISVAESFTGGGISKKLVEVSGVSEVYFEGLNTYSNEAKTARLGVKESTLKNYGAVSEQTAYEMAEGLLKSGNCDVCIATTGIAGPKSDNTAKPVGLIYIAVGALDTISVYKYNLKGDRDNVTNTAINLALFLAFKTLK